MPRTNRTWNASALPPKLPVTRSEFSICRSSSIATISASWRAFGLTRSAFRSTISPTFPKCWISLRPLSRGARTASSSPEGIASRSSRVTCSRTARARSIASCAAKVSLAIAPLLEAIGDRQLERVPGAITLDGMGPAPMLMTDLDRFLPARHLTRKRNRYFIGQLDPCGFSRVYPRLPMGLLVLQRVDVLREELSQVITGSDRRRPRAE